MVKFDVQDHMIEMSMVGGLLDFLPRGKSKNLQSNSL